MVYGSCQCTACTDSGICGNDVRGDGFRDDDGTLICKHCINDTRNNCIPYSVPQSARLKNQ